MNYTVVSSFFALFLKVSQDTQEQHQSPAEKHLYNSSYTEVEVISLLAALFHPDCEIYIIVMKHASN